MQAPMHACKRSLHVLHAPPAARRHHHSPRVLHDPPLHPGVARPGLLIQVGGWCEVLGVKSVRC